jgi:glycosyltransferase involved in cell wall biosynthesis
MRVLIATVQVPFVRGGAEILAEQLRHALLEAGHDAEIVAIPFKWYPAERILDHMLACRLLDLTESCGAKIDKLIALKFPAYLIEHPVKRLWLLHQHRTAYELWDSPHADLLKQGIGSQLRAAIQRADRQAISHTNSVFTISRNVSRRLKQFCGLDSTPLYHPPAREEDFFCAASENYLFFPSRLSPIKRQTLVLEALAETAQPVNVVFAGLAEWLPYAEELKDLVRQHGVSDRVKWLGVIDHEELRQLYASALGVIFVPLDEDYGYVTLEAMLSSKPVITCTDSGGPLEFVLDNETGLLAEPNPRALAEAMDKLWRDRSFARELGKAGRERYRNLGIDWNNVVASLLA